MKALLLIAALAISTQAQASMLMGFMIGSTMSNSGETQETGSQRFIEAYSRCNDRKEILNIGSIRTIRSKYTCKGGGFFNGKKVCKDITYFRTFTGCDFYLRISYDEFKRKYFGVK